MQREFLSAFTMLQAQDNIQRAGIDFLLGKGQPPNGFEYLAEVTDPFARIDLLAQALLTAYKDYARAGSRREGGGLLQFYRSQPFQELLAARYRQMAALSLLPALPNLAALPAGSFAIYFTFTLSTPYISKDDVGLHILDNPVRKDKVFKVPMMSAAGWKGLLRWTAMHIRLARKKDQLTSEQFAQERFAQTLLFGDEKGEEPGRTRDFAAFLDALRPDARAEYERLLRQHYSLKPDDPLPHHSGRLTFYPTFFTQIGLEVINPHDRQSNAGQQPIYLECVPAGAQGTFSLLYVPFDLIGQDEAEIRQQAAEDLQRVAEALCAMMLTYGFSAKRTSGYGTAEDEIQGKVQTQAGEKPLTSLSRLREEVKDVTF